jgi:hypothetical protein
MMMQLPGQHSNRQREVAAQAGDLADFPVGRAQARPGGHPDQQLGSFLGWTGVEAYGLRVLQRGEVPPAGHDHQAPVRAGQQRPDLLVSGCIVEEQQQLLADQMITPQPGAGVQVRRDLLRGHSGGLQQAGQRVGRIHRPLPRCVPVQGQEDLAIGELGREPVGGVYVIPASARNCLSSPPKGTAGGRSSSGRRRSVTA